MNRLITLIVMMLTTAASHGQIIGHMDEMPTERLHVHSMWEGFPPEVVTILVQTGAIEALTEDQLGGQIAEDQVFWFVWTTRDCTNVWFDDASTTRLMNKLTELITQNVCGTGWPHPTAAIICDGVFTQGPVWPVAPPTYIVMPPNEVPATHCHGYAPDDNWTYSCIEIEDCRFQP